MTSRIGQPDTDADITLREHLDNDPPASFIMVAGAGSGKTTSLVKALAHLARSRRQLLRHRGQQIACITYTDVAVKEIWGDVGKDTLFHVSTIHSFLWTVIRPFQQDLKAWVINRLNEKALEVQERLNNPRTRAATRLGLERDIRRYRHQLDVVNGVTQFRYGTGSDYGRGVLGHADILSLVPQLILTNPLLRNLIASRFPFVFVDESQDTAPAFVQALQAISEEAGARFCLGFFGDPMQKIFATGIGPIVPAPDWAQIEKPENFRCPRKILDVINAIRVDGDGLQQERGRMTLQGGVQVSVQGTARLFLLPADARRSQRLAEVRRYLAHANNDPLWEQDSPSADLRALVLLHRMAANQLGFPNLYSALHDDAPSSLKEGLEDGTAWVVRPFLDYLLPLAAAIRGGQNFEVISALRMHCPLFDSGRALGDVATLLQHLQQATTSLAGMLQTGSPTSIRDVLAFATTHGLMVLDERFAPYFDAEGADPDWDIDPELECVRAYLACSVDEILQYRKYVEDLSPFATQQGVKGAEFERVLVVIDDEEGEAQTLFSYGKYFGITALSDTDRRNLREGRDSVLDRTLRLFYVCCSRAVQDLAVVMFLPNVAATQDQVQRKGIFPAEDIYTEAALQL